MYELIGWKWNNDTFGTTGGEVTWSLSLGGLLFDSSLFSKADFEQALQAAFDTWEEIANINFRRVEDNADALMIIDMSFLSGGTIGLATTYFSSGDLSDQTVAEQTSFSDIEFDQGEQWSPYGEDGELSFFAVALHEIGHTFGLEHVNDVDQIMNPTYSGTRLVLGAGDIDGIIDLYGARTVGTNASETLTVVSSTSGHMVDGLGGNDTIHGSNFDDFLSGGLGDDTLNGNDGNDVIVDTAGTNVVNGGDGNDLIIGGFGVLTVDGGDDNDAIVGGVGNDTLQGGSGSDVIFGDPSDGFFFGNDTLTAGAGDDWLEGGLGADIFVFNPAEDTNRILDMAFDRNSPNPNGNPSAVTINGADFEIGVDKVDLSGFGYTNYTSQVAGNISINPSGHAQFSDQGTTIIFYGIDPSLLSESDFIL